MKKILLLFLAAALLFSGCQIEVVGEETVAETEQTVPVTEEILPAQTEKTVETTMPEETTIPVETEPQFDALSLARSMTVEERVGQLFLARCPDSGALEMVRSCHIGGFVLFGRDFANRTAQEVVDTVVSYQAEASIPLLIAVDEEGGTVTRVSSYSQYRESRFPSPRRLYDQGGLELLLQTEKEKCELLRSVGVNVNLAPVCDIATDPAAFMYSRSLGQSPEVTGEVVGRMVELMGNNGIGAVLKHFPGYGNNADTHTGIAWDGRSQEELEGADLVPFAAGIQAGCGAIMVAHVTVGCLDEEMPASLSAEVHSYLRQQMGFESVIVTDDLSMEAITDLYGAQEAAVLAVLAGNDLICSSDVTRQYEAVLEAVQTGRIPMEQLDRAAARVLQWKYDMNLLTKTG